jgi:hypothetical protein
MKQFKLKLPQTIRDCQPDMLVKWLVLSESIKDINKNDIVKMLDFQCQILSIFSRLSVNKIKKGSIDSITAPAQHIMEMLGAYKYQEPSEVIEIKGKRFRFEKNFAHVSTGQIIDLKLSGDITENPYAPLTIMYVEEGMEYCQEDERGRVQNPNEKREQLFREYFPGDEFLNFFNFFLQDYETRRNAILGIQTARMMMERMKVEQELKIRSGLLGQKSSIDYQKRWDKMWERLHSNHM